MNSGRWLRTSNVALVMKAITTNLDFFHAPVFNYLITMEIIVLDKSKLKIKQKANSLWK